MIKTLRNLAGYTALILLCFKAPEIHSGYIRNKALNAVVSVTSKNQRSGGTGVHVKAPSGKVYILTNAHVCEGVASNQEVYVSEDFEQPIPRRVLEISDATDACLVEAMPNYKGYLSLGSEPDLGQELFVVGHPALLPTTMTKGEFIAKQRVEILDHFGDDNCDKPKNKIVQVNTLFGEFPACIVSIVGGATTIQILPGSSGSPILNYYGKMVGLMFAGNRANWGFFVTVDDLNKFLKNY